MATTIKVRVKNENESMQEYIDNIKKEYDIPEGENGNSLIHYDSDKGEVILANINEIFENLPSKQLKKVNFWIQESLLDDIKALQVINGDITLTEAITYIIKDFFEDYRNTEKYQLYMKFKDQIKNK